MVKLFSKKKAYCFIIGFFYFLTSFVYTQDQKLADSLILIYESGQYQEEELFVLGKIALNEQNPEKKLNFAQLLISTASKDSVFDYLYTGFLEMGNALQEQGNNAKALEAYFQSLEFAHRTGNDIGIGSLMISIADTYSIMGNPNNAQDYYQKGILLLRQLGDSIKIATALVNAGDDHVNTKNFDSALVYFKEAGNIFKKVDYLIGTAYNLGNTGMVYAEQGKDVLAEQHINQAITILEDLENYYPISVYLTYMADIYTKRLDFNAAFSYLDQSLDLAKQYGLKDQISEANLKLSELYESFGDYEASHRFYKQHIAYRDSVKNVETVQQMADQRTNYEVSQKQAEVDLLDQRRKNQRNIAIATAVALLLICLLAIGLFRRNTFIKKTNKIIAQEKDRSESLLLNILPEETAQELKEKGRVEAKKFDSVTVLFTDFKGFTQYAESLSPEELVKSVDYYFSRFDAVIEKHGMEKIKTIGDAYMCAGGLHYHKSDHAVEMVRAAFEIAQIMEEVKQQKKKGIVPFDIRIGINTGPVVAGVVGTKKFAYDIWGDAVNVASRMETNSEPGKINISENTYALVKDVVDCQFRGEIEVKNRGAMKMYFVS